MRAIETNSTSERLINSRENKTEGKRGRMTGGQKHGKWKKAEGRVKGRNIKTENISEK